MKQMMKKNKNKMMMMVMMMMMMTTMMMMMMMRRRIACYYDDGGDDDGGHAGGCSHGVQAVRHCSRPAVAADEASLASGAWKVIASGSTNWLYSTSCTTPTVELLTANDHKRLEQVVTQPQLS